MLSDPDLNHVKRASKKLEFLVVQDIFLTETARLAHVVLPAASFAEKDGTFTNTERRVQRVRKAVEPPGEALEDWRIICELSDQDGISHVATQSARGDHGGDRLGSRPPRRDQLRAAGKGGLHWPCPDTEHPGTPCPSHGPVHRGLGLFHAVDYLPPAEVPDERVSLLADHRPGPVPVPHRDDDVKSEGLQRTGCRNASWRSRP